MPDAADKAVADTERAMALFEQQQRQRRLDASAGEPIAPIDCVDCSEPVSVERQRAYPQTRRCTPCAADVEQSYRRRVAP